MGPTQVIAAQYDSAGQRCLARSPVFYFSGSTWLARGKILNMSEVGYSYQSGKVLIRRGDDAPSFAVRFKVRGAQDPPEAVYASDIQAKAQIRESRHGLPGTGEPLIYGEFDLDVVDHTHSTAEGFADNELRVAFSMDAATTLALPFSAAVTDLQIVDHLGRRFTPWSAEIIVSGDVTRI